jgi:urocanate hydratase
MGQSRTRREVQGASHAGGGQPLSAPRGAILRCQGWPQEAALRMLMNSLDPEVAEEPSNLIACNATGKVLHDWRSYDAIVATLKALEQDQTLLIQSGKPAGVHETHHEAPRVLIANPIHVTGECSHKLKRDVPALLPQASAASWTYVGTQETLPTAFHIFDAIAQKHFGGKLAGKLIVSGGMGAAGGALSLAAGMLDAAFLGIDVDGDRIRRRIRAGYCDYCVNTLDEALRILKNAVRQKQGVSVGLVGDCAEVISELASRGVLPDVLTDQTGAHDLLHGYVPSGLSGDEASVLRRRHPERYRSRSRESLARHFNSMLELQKMGSVVFEFGNDIRAAAEECGVADAASAFPGFVEAYLQPMLDQGMLPVRWVALSGQTSDIRRLDDLAVELFPDDALLARWISLARKCVRFQGLSARVCWLGVEARFLLADRVNSLVAQGVFKAPLVIALDHAATDVEASSHSKTEVHKEESDGATGRAWLNAALNTASGASWLSLQTGASCLQATAVLVADGTPDAAKAFTRILKNNTALAIIRQGAADRK